MEMMNSAFVTLVQKMKEIVMLMMSVKMALFVDQTIVQFHLVLTQKLTAVLIVPLQVVEKLDSVIVTLVLKMKEIVILIMSVKMILLVDPSIAQLLLVLTLKLIAVLVLTL